MKRLLSKEFFVFLSFLLMSGVFWILTTLNETYETDVEVRLELADIPGNTVITEPLPDTIRVMVRDKGYYLVKYLYFDKTRVVRLPFHMYSGQQSRGVVAPSDLLKILRTRFGETCTILAIKADHLDFYYSHGSQKKVPLIYSGTATAKTNFYVMDVKVDPDSVVVMASKSALDTINAVYTEPKDIEAVDDSETRIIPIAKIWGAKTNIAQAKVRVVVDRLTERVLNVPVTAINVPPQLLLKTFPGRVDIKVSVGASMASRLRPEQFTITVNAEDLAERSMKTKLKLTIASKPDYVLKAWLTTSEVDYVIERTQ